MTKIFKIISLACAVLFVFSCSSKRDDDGDLLFGKDQLPNNGGSTTGKLLYKVTGKDADGTHTVVTYSYTNGKLSAAKLEEEDATTTFNITYNNGLMSKITSHRVEGTEITDSENSLQYTNGRLTSTTGTEKTGTAEAFDNSMAFTYNALGKTTRILKTLKIKDPANPGSLVTDRTLEYKLSYTGNNISVWEYTDSSYPNHNNVPVISMAFKTTLSDYDTKNNPFALLPNPFTLVTSIETFGSNAILGLSTNNYKKAEATIMGMTSTNNVTYTYNADGYPIFANGQDGSTVKYEYQ